MSLRRIPAILSFLMLGALSLRVGFPFILSIPMVVILISSLFFTNVNLQRTQSILLGIGSLAWPLMAITRIAERMTFGQPWTRLAIIFAAVTIFTIYSAWMIWPKKKQ